MNVEVKTYCLFLLSLSETDWRNRVEVQSRKLEGLSIPPGTLAFRYYDVLRQTIEHDGKPVVLESLDAVNASKLYLVNPRVMTKGEVLAEFEQSGADKKKLSPIVESEYEHYVMLSSSRDISEEGCRATLEFGAIMPLTDDVEIVNLRATRS